MRTQTRHAKRRGLAVVELAVVAPLLVLLLIGTWELGRTVQVYQVLNSAVREGARIDWLLPSRRMRRLRVLEVPYQPEAAGDFHL